MTYVWIKDDNGEEQALNISMIAKVKFGHRNVNVREPITITFFSGHDMIVAKEYGPAIREAILRSDGPRGPAFENALI